MREAVRLLAGIDNTPPYEIHLLRDGTELELAGGMPFGTTEQIRRFLDASSGVRVIHLNSRGGRMNEAYLLYKLIKERNLITYTSADCVSACSMAFLAGRERYLGEHGRLGFHSAAVGDLSGENATGLNDDLRSALTSQGASESFINKALSTPPSDMWYPSTDELLQAHIIDSVVDDRYFGISGIGQWSDAHKMESNLLKLPLFSTLAQYDPANYRKLRDVIVSGVQKGKAAIDVQREVHSVVASQMIPGYLAKGPDDPLLRYWRSQIAEMRYLARLNPQYCADLLFPQYAGSPPDLPKLLPQDLQTEDQNALADLAKGAATDPQGAAESDQIKADLQAAVESVLQQYPWAADVLAHSANYRDKPAALCGASVALFSEILSMPDSHRSGPILRYMSASQ